MKDILEKSGKVTFAVLATIVIPMLVIIGLSKNSILASFIVLFLAFIFFYIWHSHSYITNQRETINEKTG